MLCSSSNALLDPEADGTTFSQGEWAAIYIRNYLYYIMAIDLHLQQWEELFFFKFCLNFLNEYGCVWAQIFNSYHPLKMLFHFKFNLKFDLEYSSYPNEQATTVKPSFYHLPENHKCLGFEGTSKIISFQPPAIGRDATHLMPQHQVAQGLI